MGEDPRTTPVPKVKPQEIWYMWGTDRVYASTLEHDLIPGAVATPVGVDYPHSAMPEEIQVVFSQATGKSRYRLSRDDNRVVDPDPQEWFKSSLRAVLVKYRAVGGDDR